MIVIEGDATLVEGERLLAGIPPNDRNNVFAGQAVPTVIDLGKGYEAVISTNKGDMRVRLYPQNAPLTVNNFVFLANQGFYDGVAFHRVLENFMAQTGDPTGTGSGGPGYQFADETSNGLGFDRAGILAMANSGPATNGSQFFITFGETPWLDGLHTVFGEVVDGQDVLADLTRRDPTQPNQPEPDVMVRVDIYEIE